MGNLLLAIFMAIFAYSTVNIGLALEKKGANLLPKVEETTLWQNIKNFFTNKFWVIGFILTNLSFVFLAIAMNQGTLSIVAPMQAVGLIVLAVFSFFYLKESIGITEIITFVLIVIGIVLLGVTNSDSETIYTLSEINQHFVKNSSIIYLVCISLIPGILCIYSLLKKHQFTGILFALTGGIYSGIGAIFTKAVFSAIDSANFRDTLIVALTSWFWGIYFLVVITFNILSAILPQIAFQKNRAVVATPIFAVMALLTPFFGGVIIFSEWSGGLIWVTALRIIALVIITIGVLLLSYSSTKTKVQEEKDIETAIDNEDSKEKT
ncbi:MAG: hypothetical protein HZR80_20380 [Candidatus Heimdallarchaeota archaeon]